MDFMKPLMVAASGLKAQTDRMRVISENIANAESTSTQPGGDPYRRQVATFKSILDKDMGATVVKTGRVLKDDTEFRVAFEPGHPAADENGYVKRPNVNSLVESVDLREAQRSYEANLNVITATRRMLTRTLDILRA
ncbi:MAG: flagellar basal body rod protein FlgC [Pseudomonadota bacterium]